MATLTSTKIKNTYDSLLKTSDNDNITSSAKQITDGLGNSTPLYISTTQVGIGVTPDATYDLHVYSDAKVGGNLTVTGDLTVEGTTTTVDTDTLRVEDPLIELARLNTSSDAIDIGFYGKYTPSATTLYTGLFRDTGDGKYKLFKSLQEEPTTTVNTSGTGFDYADLVVGFLDAQDGANFGGVVICDFGIQGDLTGDITGDVIVNQYISHAEDLDTRINFTTDNIAFETNGSRAILVGSAQNVTFDGKLRASDGSSTSPAYSFSSDTNTGMYRTGSDVLNLGVGGSDAITMFTGNVYIKTGGTTKLTVGSSSTTVADELIVSGTGQSSFAGQVTIPETPSADTDAASKGYVDSKFEETDTLAEVLANGNTTGGTDIEVSSGDNIDFADGSLARFGAGNDLKLQHNGTNSFIDNETGALFIRQKADDADIILQSDNGSGGTETYYYLDGSEQLNRFQKNILLPDGVNISLGSSFDLQLYHDGGTESFISNTTGDLIIQNTADNGDIIFKSDDGSGGTAEYFRLDGSTATSGSYRYTIFPDYSILAFGSQAYGDLRIFHDGTHSYIYDAGTGRLNVRTSQFRVVNAANSEIIIDATENGSVDLYYDNSKKFETTAGGTSNTGTLDSTGTITVTGASSNIRVGTDTGKFLAGASNDLQIYHNGTNSYLDNTTGHLYITNYADDKDIKFLSDNGTGGTEVYFELQGVSGGTNPFTVFPDNSFAVFGNSHDLQIYHDGSNSYIREGGTGDLLLRGNNLKLQTYGGADYLTASNGAEVELYYNNSKKFETSSTGINVTGGASFTDNIDIVANNKHIRWVDTYGNWLIEVGDGANNFKIHSQSLAADYLTLEGDGQLNLGEYGSGSFTGTATYRLAVDSSGDVIEIPIGGGAVDGSGTANYVTKWSDTDTITNSIIYDNGTNVGIGTSSPQRKLHLHESSSSGSFIAFTNDTTGQTSTDGAIVGIDGGEDMLISTYEDKNIEFRTGNTERMRIDSNGNFGFSVVAENSSGTWRNFQIGGANLVTRANNNNDLILGTGFYFNTANQELYKNTEAVSRMFFNNDIITFQNAASGTAGTAITWNERMRIDSSGNVGIGLTSPSHRLDLTTSDTTWAAAIKNTDATNGYGLFVQSAESATKAILGAYSGSSYKFYVRGDGNTGIGTSSPSQKLHVSGGNILVNNGNSAEIHLNSSSNYVYGDINGVAILNAGNNLRLRTNGSERMRIDSSGNVGIGTTSPSQHISGTETVLHIANSNVASVNLDSTATNGRTYVISSTGVGALQIFDDDANSTRMLMDSSGNVGIGTDSPDGKLKVVSGSSPNAAQILIGYNSTSENYFDANTQIFRNGSYAERMRIDSSGNVGINETSPASSRFTDSNSRILDISGNAVNRGGVITLRTSDNSKEAFLANESGLLQIGMYTNNDVTFYTNNTERMRIDGSGNATFAGNVTINKASNPTKLQIGSSLADDPFIHFQTDGENYSIGVDRSDSNKFKISNGSDVATNTRITLNTSGNVGIGTSSPSAKLEIEDSGADLLDLTRTSVGTYRLAISSSDNFSIYDVGAASDRLIIDSSGNVGIGTTSPVVKLQVNGSGYFQGGTAWNGGGSEANKTDIALIIDEGDTIYTRDSNQYLRTLIKKDTGDNIQIGEAGTSLIDNINFFSGSSCSYTWYNNSSAAMKLTSTGLGIGLTSPSDKLHVDGGTGSNYAGHFVYGGTNGSYGCLKLRTVASTGPSFIDFFYDGYSTTNPVGAIVTGGTSVLYQSYSDYRLKENVVGMIGALDRVNQLKPSRFNFIGHEETVDGFLAHELQKVVPQAVSGEKDGTREDGTPKYQGVDNSQIVPLLVGAIQELKAEIETLKAQINN